MVFGKGLDDSLWYVLKADRKNRSKIVDFIKGLPSGVFSQVQIANSRFQDFKVKKKRGIVSETDYSEIFGIVANDEDSYYSYGLNEKGMLSITKTTTKTLDDGEIFGLCLIDYESTDNLEGLFDGEWLGTIATAVRKDEASKLKEHKTREYEIIKGNLGYVLIYTRENGKVNKEIGKFIKVKANFDTLTLHEINKMSKKQLIF